jgi:hypothetical protein
MDNSSIVEDPFRRRRFACINVRRNTDIARLLQGELTLR